MIELDAAIINGREGEEGEECQTKLAQSAPGLDWIGVRLKASSHCVLAVGGQSV